MFINSLFLHFYTSLKEILSATQEIISMQSDLYEDTMDFESLKAKGYSNLSSTYQLANMKVLSDQHKIQSMIQSLIHDYILFYKDCGYEIQLDSSTDFLRMIPKTPLRTSSDDIPQTSALSFSSCKSLYSYSPHLLISANIFSCCKGQHAPLYG